MNDLNVYEEFTARISATIALAGGPSEAARRAGVTLATLSRWKKGDADPSRTNLVALAKAAGVSVGWLATGEGAMPQENEQAAQSHQAIPAPWSAHDTLGNPVDLEEFVFVPRYNLQASAGHGACTDGEKPVFTMAFRKYWITNYLHADPKDLSVISVKGDSMEGVLNDRDVILINRADNKPGHGLFVLRINGDLVVKRVQTVPGGKLKVSSANEAYEPFEVDLNRPTDDFEVMGRVVWYGRQV